jgi:hypothetical protein
MAKNTSLRLWSSVAWACLASLAAALLLLGRNPRWPVTAGALLALALPDHDDPGWAGFLSSVLGRMGETLLFAAVAWGFGRGFGALDRSMSGAMAGAALLALAIVSPYVRVRAQSLALTGPAGPSLERGVRLALAAFGFWTARSLFVDSLLVDALWLGVAFTAALALPRSVRIWLEAKSA